MKPNLSRRLSNWGRTVLIGLAGTALVATTLATSNVRACVKNHELGSDEMCAVSEKGLTLSIGPLRVVFAS